MKLISSLTLIISTTVAWLIAPNETGFPMVAFFIFFTGLSSLVYFLRKEKTWFDTMLYVGILVLSFFTIYRANEVLQFLDFVFIIFFGSLLVRPISKEQGIFNILLSPLIVIGSAYTSKNIFPYTFKVPVKYVQTDYVREYIPTIIITALLLLLTIPLLASANPFFNALLQNTLNAFNLNWLFQFLFTDSLIAYIVRFIAFITLVYCIPRILTSSLQDTKTIIIKPLFSINYLMPKVAMAVLLIIFFVTQIQLYTASAQTLQSMGYTNSRLTNEVFSQVTIVAFIVFLLAYFDKSRAAWNKRLSYFLIVEAFFLVAIAFKSVYDYSSLYGFTQKRLWGYTTMIWLTGALTAFTFHYLKQTSDLRFVKQIMTLTLGVLLAVNILNFDHLIYHNSKPTTQAGIDYKYLASLSPDAHQNKEVLVKVLVEAEKKKFNIYESNSIDPVYRIISRIEFLKNKYEKKPPINSFNFTEYQEYLNTKDINTESIRQRIIDTQQKHSQE